MSQTNSYGSGLYAYLQGLGVLEQGTPEAIAQAKRVYWNDKKREWKKAKRREQTSFEIFFTTTEVKAVKTKAGKLHISATRFIKQAALSDGLVIPLALRGAIRQVLMQHYNGVESVLDTNGVPEHIREAVLAMVLKEEKTVLDLLEQNGVS